MWITPEHEDLYGLLHFACTGDFYLPLHSFTKQINKLAVAVYHKVLVTILAEWQATPPAGSRVAWFRLFICKVSKLVALGCRSTVREPKESKHN